MWVACWWPVVWPGSSPSCVFGWVWYSNTLSLRLRWERRKCSALVTCECPWLHPALFTGKIRFIPLLRWKYICNLRRFLALKRKKSSAPLKRSTYGSSLMLMPTGEAFSVATSYYHQSRKQGSILRSRLFFWRSQAADSMAAFNIVNSINAD